MSQDARRITRALLSVSDKTGLVDFAGALVRHGVELISTGGTRAALQAAGLEVTDVGDLTGFPEMMDGRVKTLHPKVHGGLLAIRENPEHEAAMLAHNITPIDLLVVNLYPFEATVAQGADFDTCIENIDIGGPAMIRAAAKNHADVAVVVDVADYPPMLAELDAQAGATTLSLRRRLAQKAYARTAAYDAAISNWFAGAIGETAPRLARGRGHPGADHALRRESPSRRRVLSHARTSLRRRHGAAVAGQGTVLQQHQRHRRGLRMRGRVRRGPHRRRRHHQACEPMRCRRRHDAGASLCQCLAVRPGLGLRRDRRREPPPRCAGRRRDRSDLHGGDHRARCRHRRNRPCRRQEEPAPSAHGRPAGPARHGNDDAHRRRRFPPAGSRQCGDRRYGSTCRDATRAKRGGDGRSPVRVPCR